MATSTTSTEGRATTEARSKRGARVAPPDVREKVRDASKNRRLAPKPSPREVEGGERPNRPSLGTRLRGAAGRVYDRVRGPALVAGKVAAVALGIALAVVLHRFVDRYVRSAPAFAIRSIEIEGNERLTDEAILTEAGVALGTNVFLRAPDVIQRDLEGVPWIARARVTRRLPGSLQITIEERRPALILLLDQPYLVDTEGAVIKPVEAGDPNDLPMVSGMSLERFESDRLYRTRILTTVVGLFAEWRAAGLERAEGIGEVHVEPNEDLTVYAGRGERTPFEARLGRGPFGPKLRRLRRVLDELARRHARPRYVYLDNVRRPERVTVRVMDRI